jgi:hypothetical protein
MPGRGCLCIMESRGKGMTVSVAVYVFDIATDTTIQADISQIREFCPSILQKEDQVGTSSPVPSQNCGLWVRLFRSMVRGSIIR